MHRDNLLFTIIGLLAGFIGGYVMQEVMAARQPARLVAGAVASGEMPAGAPAAGTAGNPSGAAAPAMEAVQQLRQRLAENPEDTVALRQLADMNYNIQNWSRAVELYERYLELQPEDFNAMTDLGVCYRASGDAAAALELFRKVRNRFPDRWQALYNEIIVLAFDLGDLEAASAAMAELEALAPDNDEVDRLGQELAKRMQGA